MCIKQKKLRKKLKNVVTKMNMNLNIHFKKFVKLYSHLFLFFLYLDFQSKKIKTISTFYISNFNILSFIITGYSKII